MFSTNLLYFQHSGVSLFNLKGLSYMFYLWVAILARVENWYLQSITRLKSWGLESYLLSCNNRKQRNGSTNFVGFVNST